MFLENLLDANKIIYDVSTVLIASFLYYIKVHIKFIKKKDFQELEEFVKKIKKSNDARYNELKKDILDLKCFISYD